MKKLNIAGKQIPAIFIALLLCAGIGSAALLEYYGTITGTAEVKQSVILPGCDNNECTYTIGDSPTIAGSTYVHTQVVKNRANQQVPIKFVTTVKKCNSDYSSCWADDGNEVTTRYYGELKLENKDTGSWEPKTGDGIEATLKYDLVSPTFNYELEAKGLKANGEYVLIYYADRQDRFVNWGGDNPGALIATVTADENGYISAQENTNIDMNLPHPDDWNLDPSPNYCNNENGYDSYNLCGGAKIWLVPSSEYNSSDKTVSWENPSSYLYETDMVDYSDTNHGDKLMMNNGKIELHIENTFNPATEPGYYKIITSVVPA